MNHQRMMSKSSTELKNCLFLVYLKTSLQ